MGLNRLFVRSTWNARLFIYEDPRNVVSRTTLQNTRCVWCYEIWMQSALMKKGKRHTEGVVIKLQIVTPACFWIHRAYDMLGLNVNIQLILWFWVKYHTIYHIIYFVSQH